MSFDTRNGTRGARQPRGPLLRIFNRLAMGRIRRKTGELLILTTVGAKSGSERQSPLRWFPSGEGWLIVASAGGAARNPAWYYNLRAHPDRATVQIGGRTVPVSAEQLHGPERDEAWRQITTAAEQFAKYQTQTDREIPIIRLMPRA
jgi:deazaflavin-dependent oxidoreductase (nitroreductase family)